MTESSLSLSQRFRRFAIAHALPSSPLYSQLALGVAQDRSILLLAGQAASRPMTNLFFAAVHHLLLSGVDHPLRVFYASLTAAPQPSEHAFPAFRSFCHAYDCEIVNILRTRRVQTNEVRRCLYLALGFDVVAREAGAYSVIDIGASAGLHLLWPSYAYNYEGHLLGDAASPVQLSCRFEGPARPSLPDAWPGPTMLVGIDLSPLDASKPADRLWLRALIFPEHAERHALLESALCLAGERPPRVVAGDVFCRLPELLEEVPSNSTCCLCHNHTLNQFSDVDRDRFEAMLEGLAMKRTIYRLSAEWIGTAHPEFVLTRYRGGDKSRRLLARVDDHGGWVRWAEA